MVQGTFVLSAHVPKTQQQKLRVKTRAKRYRYAVVVLAIAVVFFYEYCFDTPSALQENIEENYHHQYNEELGGSSFNLLYSVYSFPNVIIPLIGGTLIDRIGARAVLIITCSFCVAGQIIFAFGGMTMMFWLMLVGRTVFGVGGEVLQGAQSTIISNWFKPEELSLILGICLSFPKMGSALNNYLTPVIANQYISSDPDNFQDVGMPLFAGVIFIALGLICTFILSYVDKSTEKEADEEYEHMIVPSLTRNKSTPKLTRQGGAIQPYYTPQLSGKALPSRQERLKQNEVKDLPTINQELLKQSESREGDQSERTLYESKTVPKVIEQGEHINFKEILKLPGSYWLLIIVATFCETLFIPFLDNGNKYYKEVFIGIESPEDAGIYLVVPYVLAAVLVPVLSMWVQRVEKRSYLIMLTAVLFWLTYAIMMITQTSVELRSSELMRWLPVCSMGIGTGMFCAIVVPTLPMIINHKLLGTAFGLMEMLQNLALGVFPLIVGAIRQRVSQNTLEGFHEQSLFYFVVGCITIGLTFILKAVDIVSGCHIDKKGFRKKYIESILEPVTVVQY